MILTRTLKNRAAHGYAWIRDHGHGYDLDVNRLHSNTFLLDARNGYRCPLATAYTGPNNKHFLSPFNVAVDRLHEPVFTRSSTYLIGDVDQFLIDNGFDLYRRASILNPATWQFGPFYGPTTDRDWRVLTDAWQQVITANTDTLVSA